MGLFDHHKKNEITDREIIGSLIEGENALIRILTHFVKKEEQEDSAISTYVSMIILNNNKTTGKIMATQFKKSEQVTYVIAFTKKDGSVGDIQPGSFSISADNGNVSIFPDSTNPLTGVIKGGSDGTVNVNWTANSLLGVAIPGTIALTISDETPPPDTEVVATAITLSDATPQS